MTHFKIFDASLSLLASLLTTSFQFTRNMDTESLVDKQRPSCCAKVSKYLFWGVMGALFILTIIRFIVKANRNSVSDYQKMKDWTKPIKY